MNDTENNFLKIIKKRIIILKAFILLLISFLIIIIALIINDNIKHDIFINILGRQQMLTQIISKDENRKLIILKAKSQGIFLQSEEILNKKNSMLNDSLETSKYEYEANINYLKSGLLKYKNRTIDLRYLYKNIVIKDYINEIESIDFNLPV